MPVHVVDKPLGPSSHDVVARARRLLGTRRVGHAGTLDPLATGVLLILSEEATKLSPFLTGADKGYLAWIAFGAGTPTLDAEGPIEAWGDPSGLDGARLGEAFGPFRRLESQVPPRFSAVKRDGRAAYRDAREGVDAPPMPARPAGYRAIELLAFGSRAALPERFEATPDGWRPSDAGRCFELPPALSELPTALVALRVAAGTYVRAFARDLGQALGVPAHLAGLVRTSSGEVDLASAVPLEQLAAAPGLPAAQALPLPKVKVTAAQAERLRQGQRLPASELDASGTVGLVGPDGELVAVAELSPEGMRLKRVWPPARTPHRSHRTAR